MKIYLYYKLDRGFYETAYQQWRVKGGDFDQHLLDTHPSMRCWQREFSQQGCEIVFDMRSSFLLPQARRRHLPMPLAKLLRGGLWVTKFDPWLLQQDLIRRIEHFRPDIVFIPLGSSIWSSTLQQLQKKGVKLVQICDVPIQTMMERDRRNLPYFDLIFDVANLTPGLRQAGVSAPIEYVPLGIDPTVYHPYELSAAEQEKYGADVCFIGGLSNRFHSARRQMVEYLITQGVDIKVWGGYREHFTDSPILDKWQGQIWGEEQAKALCAAKIGLNFHVDHRPGELDRGLNIRAFELAACGVFQLLQRVPSVNEFFEEGKEIICFDSKEEMVDKIRYYLAHPDERQQITAAARQRVLREHTIGQRVAEMIQQMKQLL